MLLEAQAWYKKYLVYLSTLLEDNQSYTQSFPNLILFPTGYNFYLSDAQFWYLVPWQPKISENMFAFF